MNTIKFAPYDDFVTEQHDVEHASVDTVKVGETEYRFYNPCNLNVFITNTCQNACDFCINKGQTECTGFSVLPDEEYRKNKLLLADFRKMVALTDEMQNNLYDKWRASNDPHFPEPVVFANDVREDVKRIAERIVEIVSK